MTDVRVNLLHDNVESRFVVIEVPESMWAGVSASKGSPHILSMLILPALVSILHQMREAEDESSIRQTDWFSNMEVLLQKRNINLADADLLVAAQKLLTTGKTGTGNPVGRSFVDLMQDAQVVNPEEASSAE